MSSKFLADVIVTVHFAWIFYVLLGQLLILIGIPAKWQWTRNFWFRFTHLSMMMLVVVEVIFGIECPLTTWERGFRGSLHYTGDDSFIARWLGRIIFYDLDGGAWQFMVSYVAFGLLVIWSFWKSPPRLPMSTASFVALVHLFIGSILLATASSRWEVGACFLVQAALWYGLQERRPAVETPRTDHANSETGITESLEGGRV